ncbi:DNA-binding response regulator [Streptomyces lunaelactis]|uniref:DNA-binding response regulator n=1 Tax=Streptomyces lunaelactis TaxID=1535768 RepID=A0A2R4TF05_9ACTN|nr:response regulator transcription factor [Streptomyces lunaelactis]AVZ77718.1 DNA-binding response regulator [Streptomyces lunaelactis]NUK84667.1 response regulator transcription factor [Streptomyces lunaelactis]
MPIRVVLAEDDVLLRKGLAQLIDAEPGLEVAGEAADLSTALEQIDTLRPDVVVTDIRMPPMKKDEGIRLAALLREQHPSIGVVVLSQHKEPAYAYALFEHGVAGRGYLIKERVAEVRDLTDAVRQVAAGLSVVDPAVVETMVRTRSSGKRSALDALTPRELEVLRHMAQGKSNAAIGKVLGLTEGAVQKNTNAIFAKLGIAEERDINKRVRAVLLFLDQDG